MRSSFGAGLGVGARSAHHDARSWSAGSMPSDRNISSLRGCCLSGPESARPDTRAWIARAFTAVEDIVYVGLGLSLAGSALVLLANDALHLVQSVVSGTFSTRIIASLDRIMLILLVVELLYTVQVSFREHAIVPEPFLILGLIAAIRRVLVLTAEFGEVRGNDSVLKYFVIEIAALTVLILVLVGALVLLRRLAAPVVAERTLSSERQPR
jgi:uncharacterized membrane protein (DUF373 family)